MTAWGRRVNSIEATEVTRFPPESGHFLTKAQHVIVNVLGFLLSTNYNRGVALWKD